MLPARLSDRLRLLQWALPGAITVLAVLYQLGLARYVHDNFGAWSHYALEVLFYGTTGPIVMWLILRIVRTWVEQKDLAEPTEFRLLAALAERPGHTLPPENLLTRVWGSEYADDVENVKRYIHYLRQKLEADPDRPQLILTERGFGYYLVE
jgi:transcriptional regulator